ncbi:hypothetical protein [Streptomyces sp. Inha503]|uniref:hypothetical protein n=1 Tax=Streptomyces sp. Inha503 TaxID=3383314 RepID=UPI0039A0C5CF
MRVRYALAAVTLGSVLVISALALPAQADQPARVAKTATSSTTATASGAAGDFSPTASWHFYRSYWTYGECLDAGDATGKTYVCLEGTGTDGKLKYHLYVWY